MTLNSFRLCYLKQTLILELKKLLDDQFQDKIDAMYQEHRIVSMEIWVFFQGWLWYLFSHYLTLSFYIAMQFYIVLLLTLSMTVDQAWVVLRRLCYLH